MGFLIALTLLAGAVALLLWLSRRRLKRAAFVRAYRFPPGLFAELRGRHPTLTPRDCELVARGLRQFFLAYLGGGRRPVSMPSQVVDALWHAFILSTRHYEDFCHQAFGRFLHHTPAVVLGPQASSNAGLRRVWWQACREETIDPRAPSRLPLLFALDAKLDIPGGFHYRIDCSGMRREGEQRGAVHCAGDFGDASIDGGTDGLGDGGGDGGGGGCGGD